MQVGFTLVGPPSVFVKLLQQNKVRRCAWIFCCMLWWF